MKRTFFSLALLLAVATLTAQTKMTAREAAVILWHEVRWCFRKRTLDG